MKTYKKKRKEIVQIEDVQEPFCGSRKKEMVTLYDADPDVAEEWLYEKNCGWGPEDFSKGSNVKAWWRCPYCLRDYKAQICNRTGNQSGCPYCASKRVCTDNSLEDLYPELSKEWHPSRNGKVKPSEVIKFSMKRAFWLCPKCANEWETTIAERAFNKAGCPACYRARIDYQKAHHVKAQPKPIILGETAVPRDWYEKTKRKFKTLAQRYPKIAKQWHPTKNGKWTPEDFSKASGVKVWWKCKKGPDHEWQATISHRTKSKRGCPYCAGQKVSIKTSLAYLHPKLAKQWHPTKNNKLKPENVTTGTDRKVWWQCKKFPDHEWQASIYARTTHGTGCPKCSGAVASAQNCLQSEFPYLAAQLHPALNDGLKGTEITPKSKKRLWWKCTKDKQHNWQATVCDRTLKGSGCPFCAGQRPTAKTSLAGVFPNIAKEWDKKKNGNLKAQDVLPFSERKVYWQCKAGHCWLQMIRIRTRSQAECYECRTGKKNPASEKAEQFIENLKTAAAQANSPANAKQRRESGISKSLK